jgi:purine-binding chemotaxis protein CheW
MSGDLPEELLEVESELFDDESNGEVTESEPEERERLIIFRAGGRSFAIPVLDVGQVVETVERTRMPRTADAIYGVMDLRGEITAVIDPWVHLNLPDPPAPWDDQYVVVFETPPNEQPAGIRIDAVLGVEVFGVSQIDRDVGRGDPGPSAGNPLVEAMVTPEDDDRVAVLDTMALLDASGRHPHLTT